MKKKLLFLPLIFLLLACSILGGSSELKTNQGKWEQAAISHYSYQLNVSCFCAFMDQMPVTIEVKDGEVISMTKPDGTAIQPGDPLYDTVSPYATIDRLYSALEADTSGRADEVTVTYDQTYFYPSIIYIDFIKNAMDDELHLEVGNFEVLK